MGGIAGYYEYSYSFWADDDSKIPASAQGRMKTYFLDVRTSFKLRGNDGQTTDLGWERFDSTFKKWRDGVFYLEESTRQRLKVDYGMSDDELRSWADAALAFAKQTEAAESCGSEQQKGRVVVGLLDVLTVQQEGEPMEAARERAIKTESLIPSYVFLGFPRGKGIMSNNMEKEEKLFYAKRHKALLEDLPRIRVVEGDEAAAAALCAVCSRNSPKGTLISPLQSIVPICNHFVHPRCLYNWLRDLNHSCPLCSAPIPTDDDIYKNDAFIEQLRKELKSR